MSQFKAWSYSTSGYPSALTLKPIDLPPHPNDKEIHIQVQAAALNPVDIQLMNLPVWSIPGLRHQKGIGEDFAGQVIAVGSRVTKWKIGDRIWGFTMGPVYVFCNWSLITTRAQSTGVYRKFCLLIQRSQSSSVVHKS